MRRALIAALALASIATQAAGQDLKPTIKRAVQIIVEVGALKDHCPRAHLNAAGLGAVMVIAGIEPRDLTSGGPISAEAVRLTFETDEAIRKLEKAGRVCAVAEALYGPAGTSGPGLIEFD